MAKNKKHTIAVVDDEPVVLRLLQEQLRFWYDVKAFPTPMELLDALPDLSPSLFILDWMMPEMDGLTVCREIRRHSRFDRVPIAFYTGVEPSPLNMSAAFEAGGQSFISKAESGAYMLAHVRALVDSYSRLNHHLQQRRVMLSALKHDMANLATGLTSGVEVLTLHRAFADEQLKEQAETILRAGRGLRVLLEDLNEVLLADDADGGTLRANYPVEKILTDLESHLWNVRRAVTVEAPAGLEAYCDRRGLARCLYYIVRLIDATAPSLDPATLTVSEGMAGTRFSVSVPSDCGDALEAALLAPSSLDDHDERDELMCSQYIDTVLTRHSCFPTVSQEDNVTSISFTLPPCLDFGEDDEDEL